MPGESDRPKFVVGLGNPGREYAKTRHNVGFMVLEVLRRRWQVSQTRAAFSGQVADAVLTVPGDSARTQKVTLLAPATYMNRSGKAVGELAAFYKAEPQDMLIVLDDFSLPLGQLRARADGSAGGHNGLADILAVLGTQQTPRLRIGIGLPPGQMDPADFVLSRFGKDEQEVIDIAVQTAADAVEAWLFNGIRFVMDNYNRKATS